MLAKWRMRNARKRPLSSSASSASVTVSRACASLRNAFRALAIQCTGRLVDLRADELRDVFGIGAGLHAERAADVLGDDAQLLLRDVTITERRCRAARRRSASRRAGGSCRSRRSIASRSRRAAPWLRGSAAGWSTVTRATCLAAAMMRSTSRAFASGSGCGPGQSMARLPGASGHSCGASASPPASRR